MQLEVWFQSWVPDSVFSAGGGRSSVEAWYTTALVFEEALSGVVDSDVHFFVADVIRSFDTVDHAILDRVLSSVGLLLGSSMPTSSIILMLGYGLSLQLAWVSFGLGMVVSLRGAPCV